MKHVLKNILITCTSGSHCVTVFQKMRIMSVCKEAIKEKASVQQCVFMIKMSCKCTFTESISYTPSTRKLKPSILLSWCTDKNTIVHCHCFFNNSTSLYILFHSLQPFINQLKKCQERQWSAI